MDRAKLFSPTKIFIVKQKAPKIRTRSRENDPREDANDETSHRNG
jgi:hypothetical protein